MSSDAVILMALSLFVCGFMVTRGALELIMVIMVPAIVAVVLMMKAYFPPELLMLTAGGVLVMSILSFKNMGIFGYIGIAIVVAGAVLCMKFVLPVAVITRLAMSIIFIGALRFLLF